MFYYKVSSSHWTSELEFKSEIQLNVGDCFRILTHSGSRSYPTRFKVITVSDQPLYYGTLVEIYTIDSNVEPF